MLMEWDPIGVAGVPEAADEYDCMIAPIMRQLSEGATAGPLAAWITGERVAHFGLDAQPEADNALALELVEWWRRRTVDPQIDVREALAHEIPELPPDGSPVRPRPPRSDRRSRRTRRVRSSRQGALR
jgi:hypothetical protein